MSILGVMYALGAALCWGTAPIIYKWGMASLSMEKMNSIRAFGFLGFSLLLFLLLPKVPLFNVPLNVLIVIAVTVFLANVLGDFFFFIGIDEVGAGKSTAITCSYPLFVTIISVIFLDETVSIRTLMGTASIMLGLVLLRDLSGGNGGGKNARKGVFYSLCAAFLWGMSLAVTRWALLVCPIDPVAMTLWRSVFFMPIAWVWWLLKARTIPKDHREPLFKTSFKSWGAVFIGGGLALSIGGFLITKAMEIAPASLVSPIAASSPMIATLWGRIFFKEKMTSLQLFGIVMIVMGSVFITA